MRTGPEKTLPETILVVDDTVANLQLLAGLLKERGYRVRVAPSGALALQAVQSERPDLILLDINMPEINGYEVCARIKAHAQWAGIPVLFISAMNETLDKVKAFAAGGVDYITKPFQFEEVEARVATHLELSRLRAALAAHNRRLEEEVQQRTADLARACARLQAMDQAKTGYLSLISHELRTPLTGLLGLAELGFDGDLAPADMEEMRGLFLRARDRLLDTLNDALLLTQIETDRGAFALRPTAMGPVLARAREAAMPLAQMGVVTLAPPPAGAADVLANEELLQRALGALLKAAVKHAAPGTAVAWSCQPADGRLALQIRASGPGIAPAFLPDFWELFSEKRPLSRTEEVGFGAAVAGKIIAWLGGTATVENLDPPGVLFTVALTLAVPQPAQAAPSASPA